MLLVLLQKVVLDPSYSAAVTASIKNLFLHFRTSPSAFIHVAFTSLISPLLDVNKDLTSLVKENENKTNPTVKNPEVPITVYHL